MSECLICMCPDKPTVIMVYHYPEIGSVTGKIFYYCKRHANERVDATPEHFLRLKHRR